MDEESAKCPAGIPGWVMTFADLMTLLMCFFVLLLSFSELDMIKYKKLAGSMEFAFGIQREVRVKDTPKGTSIIAKEFSPGKPVPSAIKVMQQQTMDIDRQTLKFSETDAKQAARGREAGSGQRGSQKYPATELARQAEGDASDPQHPAAQSQPAERGPGDVATRDISGKPHQEDVADARDTAAESAAAQALFERILNSLAGEIRQGLIDLDLVDGRLIIRIHESGSFASGSAELRASYLPVIDRLGAVLEQLPGEILIAGHTDNLPVVSGRYRSNWELSSARAASVVSELLRSSAVAADRVVVQGYAETRPLSSNDGAENRAKNRRVEISLDLDDLFRSTPGT